MKPEEINVAIAEACGWINIYGQGIMVDYMWAPGHINKVQAHWNNRDKLALELPNYYEDLNAIHEAEKILPANKFPDYGVELARILNLMAEHKYPCILPGHAGEIAHATAPQRCEALLRALGKWVETKGEGE